MNCGILSRGKLTAVRGNHVIYLCRIEENE